MTSSIPNSLSSFPHFEVFLIEILSTSSESFSEVDDIWQCAMHLFCVFLLGKRIEESAGDSDTRADGAFKRHRVAEDDAGCDDDDHTLEGVSD